ncbi:RyR domain-containing protein [Desulfitobacterium sp.]|uniref:RyR domain-containing protein n=1 Tax=Desulfitobacterium sp. TaxID=49981 RepID=UPI002C470A73|nr:RyR domain-containing protein [Desulfitobacterium sp.]HVJ50302.1 RyR domain-containing protein [Desulfitobacterium sp.]
MDNKNLRIVVSGDICNNSLIWKTHPQCIQGLSWQDYPLVHHLIKPGEALLLSKLVALSTGATVLSPQIEDFEGCSPKDVLLSSVDLALFPLTAEEKDPHKVYRVKDYLGFTGPTSGILPKLFSMIDDDENADMVIIDDENNGFNSEEEFWPLALKAPGKTPIVIYKINNPDRSTKLWNQIETLHLDNTVVVINGDDLRSKGVNISRSLSWERTALDFVWQMNNNPDLNYLTKCHHLIVPFGLEGAIYYQNEGFPESHLYFLTYEIEGGFIKENQGKMYGLTSCFVAGLAHAIASGMRQNEELNKTIDEGIREGIVAAQKYFSQGFGENPEKTPFPNPAIFIEGENDFIYKEQIQDVLIRNSNNPNCQSCWYIIKDKSSTNLAEISYDIVKNGEKSALKFIPIARFGNLKVVDRTEIEGYRSIKNLIGEYVSAKNVVRPLSIAVFGTPGSGKSFGVAEVATSIAPKFIEKLNFNLSQFQNVLDLFRALHNVRDLALMGKIPLVFFDEFDSRFEGKLGWLKYFLAPMQDGVFREGDSVHPIGKAIFVFAGGTSSTYQEFSGEDIKDENEYKQFITEFQSAKGPDFISRLRGYVNILGPNQTDDQWDQLFIVRRAMLLRSLMERRVPHLINENGEAQIDSGVLRALLKVTRYKHEARSMEAILEMSTLNNAKKWEQSYLPSKEQLKLHVDEEQFSRLLMRDTFFSEKIEKLARDLNYKNITALSESLPNNLNPRKAWENLSEELKNSTRDQIRHIPSALQKVNYDLISVKEKPETIQFTNKELDILAKYEHKRRSLKEKEAGWKWGEQFDDQKKTDPSLTPWESLSSDAQNRIIENIKPWPEILAGSNFKIERLKFLCYCETHLTPVGNSTKKME